MSNTSPDWIYILGNIGSFLAGLGGLVAAGAANRSARIAEKATLVAEESTNFIREDIIAKHLAEDKKDCEEIERNYISVLTRLGEKASAAYEEIIATISETYGQALKTNKYNNIFYKSSIDAGRVFIENEISYETVSRVEKILKNCDDLRAALYGNNSELNIDRLLLSAGSILDGINNEYAIALKTLTRHKDSSLMVIDRTKLNAINVSSDKILYDRLKNMIQMTDGLESIYAKLHSMIYNLGRFNQANGPELIVNLLIVCALLRYIESKT